MTKTARESAVFEGFFRSASPRLTALAYVFTGDRSQAQDLAQETLTRAWERWETVSGYDDPVAWCRRVLCNLATSEWRKRTRHHRIEFPEQTAPEPDVEALELARALKTLPPQQRTAVVLHDAGGLLVVEVAKELDVSEGTIRSWLSRGRKALAVELSISDNETRGAAQ